MCYVLRNSANLRFGGPFSSGGEREDIISSKQTDYLAKVFVVPILTCEA